MTGAGYRCDRMAEASIVKRLQAAGSDVDRARIALRDTLERRDRLIVEAADQGVSYRTIARAADLSHPGVVRVLATPHAWLQELAER